MRWGLPFGAYSNSNVNKSTTNSTIKAVITHTVLSYSSLKPAELPTPGFAISCNANTVPLQDVPDAPAGHGAARWFARHEKLPSTCSDSLRAEKKIGPRFAKALGLDIPPTCSHVPIK